VRERVVLERDAHGRQVAAEAHDLALPGHVEGRVERRVLGPEHRLRQNVGDLVERELLGAQREGSRLVLGVGAALAVQSVSLEPP
jgi:hypothetical protein